jgi:hypothetical protein
MEDPGLLIADTVRSFVGCRPAFDLESLAKLCARDVDDLPTVSRWLQDDHFSTCAFFALGIWRHCGVNHPILERPYKTGMAMAWCLKIAADLGALVVAHPNGMTPPVGALLHYATQSKNNDHVEFCLSEPDEHGLIDHAGGGRSNHEITLGHDTWKWSFGRPLQNWVDPVRLLSL